MCQDVFKVIWVSTKSSSSNHSADVTGSHDKGTGLGLPICKRVAEEHGGNLDMESEVGNGTCFRITIPAVESEPSPQDGNNRQN